MSRVKLFAQRHTAAYNQARAGHQYFDFQDTIDAVVSILTGPRNTPYMKRWWSSQGQILLKMAKHFGRYSPSSHLPLSLEDKRVITILSKAAY